MMPTRREALDRAFAEGQFDRARRILQEMSEEDRELLALELGSDEVRALRRSARRRRGPKHGRVIVLNGIMGANLDSEDTSGDRDRVWLNVWRIARGRFRDFELRLDGRPKPRGVEVRVAGLHKTYYKLLLELDASWHVKPFPFDWRLDISDTADLLARTIRSWAGGEPVHLVAHSMGGLVCRRFIHRHGDLWRQMDDPTGAGRGGRLIMMGTPNRGSFAIPLMLTGVEKKVTYLAAIDTKHSKSQILRIISTFPGGYQMLPSPDVDLDDDHVRLFRREAWGEYPVNPSLLARAEVFQRDMSRVLTPGRLVYVAGYDQETVHRVRIPANGRFEYEMTHAGDGRVPHSLGLLDGVDTYWVRESHGALPKNDHVLDAAGDLLLHGATSRLPREAPSVRAVRGVERWHPAEELAAAATDEAALKALGREARAAAERRRSRHLEVRALRAEALLMDDDVSIESDPLETGADPVTAGPPPSLAVDVVWGDVTRATGDVYCVGHYEGVLPQNAEWALDRVVSERGADEDELVLRSLTRRGVLRGELGSVSFFPWARRGKSARPRVVAVAGMGQPGTFERPQLRQLGRSLAWAVGSLPNAETVCTVLIGAGAGNLDPRASVHGLLSGLADALGAGLETRTKVKKLRIIERRLDRAHEAHDAVAQVAEEIASVLRVRRSPRVKKGPGGVVATEHGWSLALAALLGSADNPRSASRRRAASQVLGAISTRGDFGAAERDGARRAITSRGGDNDLVELAREHGASEVARRLEVSLRHDEDGRRGAVSRVSFIRDRRTIRVAAITDTAVVPEREVRLDEGLVSDLVAKMTDPDPADLPRLSRLMRELLVPKDLLPAFTSDATLIVETDRAMAAVGWELLERGTGTGGAGPAHGPRGAAAGTGSSGYVGTRGVVARQLRTGYSPPISPSLRFGIHRRALVIGDPGDPDAGDDLPGARLEAERVAELLTRRGFRVDLRLGAPTAAGGGAVSGVKPATRLEVLERLLEHDYDVLHYAGHGDFDPEHPDESAGWLFADGFLTAGALARVSTVPQLVVANACLSGRLSRARRGEESAVDGPSLLPGLADEFLRRGVRNYVGTAWEVLDDGAIEFAEVLYDRLLPGGDEPHVALGEAVRAARSRLQAKEDAYGALWLAYRHYGDPWLKMTTTGTGR